MKWHWIWALAAFMGWANMLSSKLAEKKQPDRVRISFYGYDENYRPVKKTMTGPAGLIDLRKVPDFAGADLLRGIRLTSVTVENAEAYDDE